MGDRKSVDILDGEMLDKVNREAVDTLGGEMLDIVNDNDLGTVSLLGCR
jgi:hypothetical protein